MNDMDEHLWIRKKLGLPADATSGDVYGRMHVWDSRQHGYMAYIVSNKCDDKQGAIARLVHGLKVRHLQMLTDKNELHILREVAKAAERHRCLNQRLDDALTALSATTKETK